MRRWLVVAVLVAGCGGQDAGAPPGSATPREGAPREAATGAPRADAAPVAVRGFLPGATALATCAAAGDYWPTMTLALDRETAWVACKEDSAVESLAGGKVALDGQAIAVLSAFGAVWALSGRGTLLRVGGEEIDLEAGAPYNLWSGAGSLWAIDDASGEVIRIDPRANAVVEKTHVGDGPADMAFDGNTAYVINHRDRTLVRLGRKTALATIGDADAAPERMALLDGALWITGRGMDLLRVDPRTGRTLETVEIGGSGIDIVAAGDALYVPSRSEAVDRSGLPTMESLRRVTKDGRASVITEATDRVDVHGIVADDTHVWLADNRAGIVYRIALTG